VRSVSNNTTMASESDKPTTKMQARWYFGGLGSAGAACCTHPLDLLKVVWSCHCACAPIGRRHIAISLCHLSVYQSVCLSVIARTADV